MPEQNQDHGQPLLLLAIVCAGASAYRSGGSNLGLPVTLWCSDDELHYAQGIHYLFVLCITDWTGDIGQQAAAALFPIFNFAQCLLV